MPWGILILFGGGLSLAAAVEANGVAEFFAGRLALLGDVPPVVVTIAVVAAVIFLTELTSNTATTAALVPLLAAGAGALGLEAVPLVIAATLAASFAFMMPVATPPNAIVFSSGRITIPQMCRAGFLLNIIGVALITLAAWTVVRWAA
jgi:sodium-dependent dicarboxylate transporter 2/3/5